ncbi:MAG: peptidoglycan editing factor PgeF [Lachnospiraceae bacterium]
MKEREGVPYFTFPALDSTGLVRSAFSTRIGGVSQGQFASMNFNTILGDDIANVEENFRRFCSAAGLDWDRAFRSYQTHTTNILEVTEDMVRPGRDFWQKSAKPDIDGLVTDVPGTLLIGYFADCVPLYFLDPVCRAIGLSHSGWKGTLHRMGAVTVNTMRELYGSRPENLIVCIGPSICRDCYEVSQDVRDAFAGDFSQAWMDQVFSPNVRGRYQMDLWKANELILTEAGVLKDHVTVTNICTCCNHELLFSHRYTGGKRGNLCAFLQLL